MSRVRPFILRVAVSAVAFHHAPSTARGLAREMLLDQAVDLRGPRGGRYEPINQPHDFRETEDGDSFLRNERVFTARVSGRYVRPIR